MEQGIILVATILVLLLGLIGLIDGFYYHLWKFKLHLHSETRFEHWTHTIRAATFLAILFLFFLNDYGGKWFLLGVVIVILDIIVLVVDMVAEGNSRQNLGGLPHKEYIIHVVANTLHFISLALIMAAKPLTAWNINSPTNLHREFPEFTQIVAENLIPGATLLVLGHVLLMNKKIASIFNSLQHYLIKQF